MYLELCADIWNVFRANMDDLENGVWCALTPDELAAKLTGMHRVITIMRDNGALSYDDGNILRQLCRDCRSYVRSWRDLFWME